MNKSSTAESKPVVVAHRGDAANFPENSIASLQAAANCGVRNLEFDIQLSADQVPVLLHDDSLLRTAGIDQIVSACVASELVRHSIGEANRFGEQFQKELLPTLEDVLSALPTDRLTMFVELKRHSLRAFGRRRVLDAVLPILSACEHDVVLVSFDYDVLHLARNLSGLRIALVLESHDESAITNIVKLAPEFVFCNEKRLPRENTPLWCGDWQWVIYEVTSQQQAMAMHRRGAAFVESMQACQLHSELQR